MGKHWTDRQKDTLKKLFNQGHTDKEIAQKLNEKFGTERSWKAVESKRRYIGLQNKPKEKWTKKEEQKLKKAVKKGLSVKEISEDILTDRTADAIRIKKQNLQLTETRDYPLKKWSKKEEKLLRKMIKNGKYTEEIAKELNRTTPSVYKKIDLLGLTRKEYNTWSPEETRRLKSLVDRGYTDKEIARIMGRTSGSIRGKRRAENIPKQVDDLQ